MTGNNQDWGDLPYEAARLITKFLQNDISAAEMEQLHTLLDTDTRNRLLDSYKDTAAFKERLAYMRRLDQKAAWKKVLKKQQRTRRASLRRRLAYAVTVLLVVAAATYWLAFPHKDDRIVADHSYGYKNDVLPGTAQAELILSNGKKVMLRKDSIQLEEEDGTLLRSNMGALRYSPGQPIPTGTEPLYNTLRVPQAGTFFLTLADGTKVWLNAESELTFPLKFSGNERTVSLKGEGYFEVAQDASRSFKVTVHNHEIQVLGTSFNIAAYHPETSTTTLLSGKVMVSAAGKKAMLKPGQQAVSGSHQIVVGPADVEKATAWKNGYFYFSNDPINTIMDQVARWYGISVRYNGNIARNIRYGGSIGRDAKLSEVLEQLKSVSQLNFQIDGKEVTIGNNAGK